MSIQSTNETTKKCEADSQQITVSVNEETVSIQKNSTIADLLNQLNLHQGPIAVEVNLKIVPKTEHHSFQLRQNDQLEIVSFVGGG